MPGTVAQLAFSLFNWILDLHGWVVLAVVFALPALEASAFLGFVFPGEIAVLLGGVLASRGRVSVAAVIAVAILGAVIGDSIGYWVGGRWGRRMIDASIGKVVKREHFDRAEEFVGRRGGPAVFLGRWTTAFRVLVPGLAGMSRMRYRTFLLYNVAGGVAWATAFVLLGYFAGESYHKVSDALGRAGLIFGSLVVGILVIALVARWIARHPDRVRARWERFLAWRPVAWIARTFEGPLTFISNRFRPGTALGLELTIGFVAIGLVGWVFGLVTQHVILHPSASVDQSTFRFFVEHRTDGLTTSMKIITAFGSAWVLGAVAVGVGMAWYVRKRTWRPLVLLVGAWAGSSILTNIVKALVDRPRPPAATQLVEAARSSFPSGHVSESTAVYGMLAVLIAGATRSWRSRVAVWTGTVVLLLLIGVSRLYLGVHWLTDVVGGYALGAMWMVAMLMPVHAADRARAQRSLRSSQSSGKNRRSSVVRR
jgi:membrane protein DedA with SNARE-associated domain/membrane-associated phospholipid phosphatase